MTTRPLFRSAIRRISRKNSVPSSKSKLAQSLKPTGGAKKLGSLHVARDTVPHRGKQASEFTSPPAPPGQLPGDFTSPPLLPGLLQSVRETLGQDATPSAIQALSLKHVTHESNANSTWTEYLLASETGSGKSLAYLLPLLQDLKRTELDRADSLRKSPRRRLNPRALILAPTHELSRQITTVAKKLSHNIKLRILCASRENKKNSTRDNAMDVVFDNSTPCDQTSVRGSSYRGVDVLVGTPMKLLELEKGRGWDWEQRAHEKAQRSGANLIERKFWVDEPEMGLENIEWVIVDEADILFDPDFQASTRQLLADIAAAKGQPVPSYPVSTPALNVTSPSPNAQQPISYPFHFLLTSATIPNSLSNYLSHHHPALVRLASPNLHHLPNAVRTEHARWTGGNKDADIERRIRRVWAEDALKHAKSALPSNTPVQLSKILVFCNKRSKVEQLAGFLGTRGVACVALTSDTDARKRGNNHHLDGFMTSPELSSTTATASRRAQSPVLKAARSNPALVPHVLVTTSLLSRGLDFSPEVKHVFIVDEPRNMIDFLHRAGRTGRAGESGKVVVFGRGEGRGSGRAKDMRRKIQALA